MTRPPVWPVAAAAVLLVGLTGCSQDAPLLPPPATSSPTLEPTISTDGAFATPDPPGEEADDATATPISSPTPSPTKTATTPPPPVPPAPPAPEPEKPANPTPIGPGLLEAYLDYWSGNRTPDQLLAYARALGITPGVRYTYAGRQFEISSVSGTPMFY
ncbi:MAG: hypothetical protein FWD11_00720 [Micrococcales bacterium]|nr:hypothetical protein [Micrococcales bacterium]